MAYISRTTGSCSGGFACVAIAIAVLTLPACGGSGASTTTASSAQIANTRPNDAISHAEILSSTPGVSPFIQQLSVYLSNLSTLSAVEFNIAPKPGSVSKAVDVSYSAAALKARGYISEGGARLTLPVFGLYAGYTNQVTLHLSFQDGSTQTLVTPITTLEYNDPTGLYQRPTILTQRTPGSSLGFDFFYIKSGVGSPIVIDTDGEIRWAAPGIGNSMSTAMDGDEFVIGDPSSPTVHQLRLDGARSQNSLASTIITNFHHNIDRGAIGLLADVNTQSNGTQNIETTVTEISNEGSVLSQWDLAAILSAYMLSQGDDPTTFVRPGVDWFHNNSTTYDATDDTVIISSRENFVIKLDYHTGKIIWILGDPTKYWYTYPSLRAKALTLAPGGLYPIGQHALSILSSGQLMLFNDGLGSVNQPAGTSPGLSRTFSAVSAYAIDVPTMTAQNVWNFEYGQTIYSDVCSSAYGAPDRSLLIDYATADNDTTARLVGLNSDHTVAFDFGYPTTACNTSWNAVPIALDHLVIE